MNCPYCSAPHSKTLEVRRTPKHGLRRRLVCGGCRASFSVYGGATAPELEKARTVLREKGYLR